MEKSLSPHTIAAQAGGYIDRASGGVVPPLQPSTTFARDENYQLLNAQNAYIRDNNDVVRVAEGLLAQFEGANTALLWSSGMAAIAAVFRALPTGAVALVQSQIYWGTTDFVRSFAARRGIKLIEADLSDASLCSALCQKHNPDLIFVETPSNPWLRVVDVAHIAGLAHDCGAKLVVDGTASTPVLMRALDLGADIVVHSATKALNGHSDVLAGVLLTNDVDDPLWQQIAVDRHDAGAVLGPFEAWLLIRGMRTLPLRVERMCANALALAQALYAHDAVEDVFFPGLPSHKGHAVATGQMQGGYGFLMSVLVKGGMDGAAKTAGALKLFHRATSLGGVESLVEHRVLIEPHTGIPENLLRVSVGIEDVNDLITDFQNALEIGTV